MSLHRQHEKALLKTIDKIVTMIIAKENDLQSDIDLTRASDENIDKLARMQDLSSRRYQTKILKREIKKILLDSKNLLIAPMVGRLN